MFIDTQLNWKQNISYLIVQNIQLSRNDCKGLEWYRPLLANHNSLAPCGRHLVLYNVVWRGGGACLNHLLLHRTPTPTNYSLRIFFTWRYFSHTSLMMLGYMSYFHRHSWWCDDMEVLSTLLALCEGNPLVTSGFPSQRASNAEHDSFSLLLVWTTWWSKSH